MEKSLRFEDLERNFATLNLLNEMVQAEVETLKKVIRSQSSLLLVYERKLGMPPAARKEFSPGINSRDIENILGPIDIS